MQYYAASMLKNSHSKNLKTVAISQERDAKQQERGEEFTAKITFLREINFQMVADCRMQTEGTCSSSPAHEQARRFVLGVFRGMASGQNLGRFRCHFKPWALDGPLGIRRVGSGAGPCRAGATESQGDWSVCCLGVVMATTWVPAPQARQCRAVSIS